ncbi:MAG TPA: MFS transporter [Candidatus Scatomorpha pullistercoris]|uniref:MFS transporter n=1 Tax=Candidatus Scatomorpha pullistercoris TaxID=2840929 RepID=A0A9D1G6L0_9FIRM|nr:MFS transporter [Candidatus Scatomorpha pullistercoris]
MQREKLFNRDFTLLALGQAFSLVGNYALKIALSMYVLELTGSAAVFAGMLALAMVPTILLSPFGGILADRCDRRKLMAAIDAVSGAVVLLSVPAVRYLGGTLPTGALLVVLSVLGAFESPTVQACVPQLLSGDNILRGNSVVNQIQALAGLVTPFLGSLMYAALGLETVLLAAGLCFLVTAVLECFIRLGPPPERESSGFAAAVREDFRDSLCFLRRDEPAVLRLLLLAACASFFAAGTAVVGFPHLVRNVLGLSVEHYGAAESAMGAAAVLGALAAGLAGMRLKKRELLITCFGLSLLLAGLAFLLLVSTLVRYLALTAAFCAGQLVCTMFSVLALSEIQQRTPEGLTGKVMALTITFSMCAQPLGQVAYGALFDWAGTAAQLVLLPTGTAACALGLAAARRRE